MSAIKDGGPAFPFSFENMQGHPHWLQSQGMSLRDWFAGQAMIGILAMAGCHRVEDAPNERLAAEAYMAADAMLAAREAKP